jgi:WD40 repeat protein
MDHNDFLQSLASVNKIRDLTQLTKNSLKSHDASTLEQTIISQKNSLLKEDLGEVDLHTLRRRLKRGEILSITPSQVSHTLLQKFKRMKTVFCHSSNDEESWYTSQVYHVIFDHTGDYIITGGNDKLIKIFQKSTLKLLKCIRGHTTDIAILTMSSNNKFLASCSENGEIRIWNFPTGEPLAILLENKGSDITSLTLQEEEMAPGEFKTFLICTSTTNGIYIYEQDSWFSNEGLAREDQKFYKLRGYSHWNKNEVGFSAEEIHPETGLLAAWSCDHNIFIWDRLNVLFQKDPTWALPIIKISNQLPGMIEDPQKAKEFINWSPNGKILLNVGEERLRFYEFDFKKKIVQKSVELINYADIHHRRKNVEKISLACWSVSGKYCINCFN